jgi:RpiB/LacA/LacB family sugar-phosphate isomerase
MKKYNLVVPLAGKGQRMIDGGFTMPKPLIMAGDRHIIDYSLGSIHTDDCNIIFIVRQDHICNYSIDKVLKSKYGDDIHIVVSDKNTRGSVESCFLAENLINNDIPLIIFCPDIYFEPKFIPIDDIFENDGFILTFKANSSNYSYVSQDENNVVKMTAEKVVISDNASVGVYCFKTGKMFVEFAELEMTNTNGNELYICPLYNKLIEKQMIVKTQQVPIMYIMGTPEELAFFKGVVFPYFLPRSLILCSDHSGFEMKEKTKAIIQQLNIHHIDVGCYSNDDCDYSDYVNQAVELRTFFPGALILGFCRSGQGVNICANKSPNIRGALISNSQTAALAIRHNAANFFSIPAGNTDIDEMNDIIGVLISEKFEGGRHQNRIQKMMKK